MRRILRRTANDGSHQRSRQDAGLADVVSRLTIAEEAAIRIRELMVSPYVEGILNLCVGRVIKKVVGGRRALDVG